MPSNARGVGKGRHALLRIRIRGPRDSLGRRFQLGVTVVSMIMCRAEGHFRAPAAKRGENRGVEASRDPERTRGSGATRGYELGKKLYVGNLSFNTTEAELRELFGKHGSLQSVNVISDRETGRSRGFGFVEFDEDSSAEKAQQALDGQDLGGRSLRVNEAHERGGGRGSDR